MTLGLRRQRLDIADYAYNTGAETRYDESRTSPVAGIVYRATQQLAVYANYIEGLTPGETAPTFGTPPPVNAGESLAPYVSKQIEVGAKLDWRHARRRARAVLHAQAALADRRIERLHRRRRGRASRHRADRLRHGHRWPEAARRRDLARCRAARHRLRRHRRQAHDRRAARAGQSRRGMGHCRSSTDWRWTRVSSTPARATPTR